MTDMIYALRECHAQRSDMRWEYFTSKTERDLYAGVIVEDGHGVLTQQFPVTVTIKGIVDLLNRLHSRE